MPFVTLKTLIERDLKEFENLLLEDYEGYSNFNPELHQKTRLISLHESLVKQIQGLTEVQRFVAEKQLELAILKARKKHLEQLRHKTVFDLEQIETILKLIDSNYKAIVEHCKKSEPEDRKSKNFILFNRKLVKNNDAMFINEQEKKIFAYQLEIKSKRELLSTLSQGSDSSDASLKKKEAEVEKEIKKYEEKIDSCVKSIISKYTETGKVYTRKAQDKIFSLAPNATLPKKKALNTLLDDKVIKKYLDEISHSFRWWFNPLRFLSNLEKLNYHIKKITNISSEESYSNLRKVLTLFFEKMSAEQLKSIYAKFRGKIFNAFQTTQMPEDDIASVAVFADLSTMVENIDAILVSTLRNKGIQPIQPILDNPKEKTSSKNYIIESIDTIIKNAQQRPISQRQEMNRDVVWSQYFTASNADKIFPKIHNVSKTYKSSEPADLEEFCRVDADSIILDKSRVDADSSPTSLNISDKYDVEEKIKNISQHTGVQQCLLHELKESSLLGADSALFNTCLANSSKVARYKTNSITLTAFNDGSVLCQVIRSMTELKDLSEQVSSTGSKLTVVTPILKELIDPTKCKEPIIFDTTFIISPDGRNKAKLAVKEHNIHIYDESIYESIKQPIETYSANTNNKGHRFTAAQGNRI